MILVCYCFDSPMVILKRACLLPWGLRGLNRIPKSEIRGVKRGEEEGIWLGWTFWGRARGRFADTSPEQVVGTC